MVESPDKKNTYGFVEWGCEISMYTNGGWDYNVAVINPNHGETFFSIILLQMVIFHGYVSLPEGTMMAQVMVLNGD